MVQVFIPSQLTSYTDGVSRLAAAGGSIEQVLDDWLRIHSPRTAERFPIAEMRALRERVFVRVGVGG